MRVFLKVASQQHIKILLEIYHAELRDRFTMRVIKGAITSIYRDQRIDGTGSDEQVDFGDDKIKYLIFSI